MKSSPKKSSPSSAARHSPRTAAKSVTRATKTGGVVPGANLADATASSAGAPAAAAPDSMCGGNLPPPAPEHAWLQRFVGEWDVEVEARMAPDAPPFVSRGVERIRSLGGYWVVGEAQSATTPYCNVSTIGFDPGRAKYIGTWQDSMSSHLWTYEGTVNAAGDTLTLETEGPAPFSPQARARYRDVTEFKSKNHRVFTSSRLEANGNWITHVTVHSRRRK